MVKLMTAEEAAETARQFKETFERDVLEGPAFKAVVRKIETAAQSGQGHCRISDIESDDLKKYQIIQTVLIEAGYKCELKPTPLNNHSLAIMW